MKASMILGLGCVMGVVTFAACGDDEAGTTTASAGPGQTAASTSGAGATGGSTSTATGTGGGAGGADACAVYCGDNVANCDAENAQYPDQQTCEAMCEHFVPGMEGEMVGDTLACRTHHTGEAESDPAASCVAAGPYGGGVCGTTQCEVFCGLLQSICTGPNQQYENEALCLADCLTLPDATTPYALDTAATGDSLACRGYHLQAAAAMDAVQHCPHAGGAEQPCM